MSEKWSNDELSLNVNLPKVELRKREIKIDECSVTRLGNFSKPLATISLPKSLAFLGNFCKGVKVYHFSIEIIFGQLLQTFGDFYLVTLYEA